MQTDPLLLAIEETMKARRERRGNKDQFRDFTPKVRAELFRRSSGKCGLCPTTENLQADHIIPWVRGGQSTLENGRVLCRGCNIRVYKELSNA